MNPSDDKSDAGDRSSAGKPSAAERPAKQSGGARSKASASGTHKAVEPRPPTKASASSSGALAPVGRAPSKASASQSGAENPVGGPEAASASTSGISKPARAPDSASATQSGLLKAIKKTDSATASSSGLTVMVLSQSGHKAKRMNIPRWLIFAAAFAWLSLMVAAFVWGFESAAPKRPGKSAAGQSKIERTAMGPSPSSRQ